MASSTQSKSAAREINCNSIRQDAHRLAGRIAASAAGVGETAAGLLPDIRRIRHDLDQHIDDMEGIGGLLQCILRECPRLSMGVDKLAEEHQLLLDLLHAAEQALLRDDSHALPPVARELRLVVEQHFHESNSLVVEAYSTDIGTKD